MDIVNFFKKFATPVLILDCEGNFVDKNNSFDSLFSGNTLPAKFKKFKNSLSIQDSCMLYPENITGYNPIDLAIETPYDFKAMVSYQKSNEEYLSIFMSVFKYDDYFVFEFVDFSDSIKLDKLSDNYNKQIEKLNLLELENKQREEVKEKAQTQAIKMALLNRIFEALRQSINLDTTLNTAFKEISDIFGFSKVMFALYDDDKFNVKNVYPSKYSNEIGTFVEIDDKSITELNKNKFVLSNIAPKNKAGNFAKAECRILCPIYHSNKLLGVIVGIFPQNNLNNISEDMVEAVSSQLTSAIVQSYLFQELNSKNDELQSAFTKLEQTQLQLVNSEKMASLGQLVAGVAHEINTPLASINSNNSIFEKLVALNNFDVDIIDTLKSMLETDKEAIKRISNIVKSLKRFVRLDEAELQNADINKELDLTLELLKHETKNRIEIIKNYEDFGEIKCYPNLLNQVFMNILMNGIQSIENEGKIFITTSSSNNTMFVSIKDTGSGMDDATKEKIFKSGFTTKKVGIGTGLGLMISKDIIEKHSGTITFTSEKGKGTEFVISIPILRQG